MSQQYQVLARKYRPKNFHELVGQTHVSKALINAIDHNRLHHAYLFTGTRGVGKTTIARILSKCLNCETGVTSTPCGVCSSCVAIDEGRFIDLIEIDAASRTKVEDTRELIDNVPYAPTQGRYKVYLIDEVHMLSTHSFNALLKTLEEPPEHVKFLLATTDPQKLPITIISRCLQFVLRPLPQQAISEHLANLLTQEGVGFTQPALWQLANAAKGSVRDALSLTDQAIAFGQGVLTDDTVNEMLGLIDSADLVRLVLDIYQGDTTAVAAHIEQMRAQMVDAGSMFDGLAELLHQIAVAQLLPNVSLNVNEVQAQQIMQLVQQITPDVLQLYYQIVVQSREQIKLANTPLQALEMCLLRLLAFRPLADNEVVVNQTDTDEPAVNANTSHSSDNIANHDSTVNYDSTANNSHVVNTDSSVNHVNDFNSVNDTTTSTSIAASNGVEHEQAVEQQHDGSSSLHTVSEPMATHEIPETTEISCQVTVGNEPSTLQHTNVAETSLSESQDLVELFDLNNATINDESEPFEREPLEVEVIDSTAIDNNAVSATASESEALVIENNASENNTPNLVTTNSQTENQNENSDSTVIADTSLIDSQLVDGQTQTEAQALTEAPVTATADDIERQPQKPGLAVEDPRQLLKTPWVELDGEWTAEKWDYWLQTARDNGTLAQDELALARQGIMTGEVHGNSEFKVPFDTKNMQNIFQQLAQHLVEQFNAEISISIDPALKTEGAALLPENRQKSREFKAIESAKNLINLSPVMQILAHDFKGKIVQLKLLDTE